MLDSQHNGTNPICRSSGHSPGARLVNREDTNVVKPPSVSTPSTFQVTHFQWSQKIVDEVHITIQASPFVLSHNTLKGDDWVEEEGLGKILIFFKVKDCQCSSLASIHPNYFYLCFYFCFYSFHLQNKS